LQKSVKNAQKHPKNGLFCPKIANFSNILLEKVVVFVFKNNKFWLKNNKSCCFGRSILHFLTLQKPNILLKKLLFLNFSHKNNKYNHKYIEKYIASKTRQKLHEK